LPLVGANISYIESRDRSKINVQKLVEWNIICFEVLFDVDFVSSGRDDDNVRMEILELDDHPYFIATQYHPEYLSRPLKPSPPFLGLILASVGKLHSYLARGCRLTPRQLSDDDSGS
jgi:CTP synthase (UTP-ammonia lyase)